MTVFQESLLYRLWMSLLGLYAHSGLRRVLQNAGGWCRTCLAGSALLAPVRREGRLPRLWRESRTCRALTVLVNLPAALLHRLFNALTALFQNSAASRTVFALGAQTSLAQSWLIMLLWVIPFSAWNNAYSLLAFVLLLVLFYAGGMARPELRLDVGAVGFYPVIFFAAVTLGAITSCLPEASRRFYFYHLAAALCVLVTVSAVRSVGDLKRLAAGGAFCVAVSSAVAVSQRIKGVAVNPSYVDLSVNAGILGRVQSLFDNPNTFAEVLILLLPLVLALALGSKRPSLRLLALGIFALGTVALAMTYSRASWVGFAFSLVVFVLLWQPRLLPLFFLGCLVAVPLLPQTVWNRILTIGNLQDSSTASRAPLYEAALRALSRRPIRGAGLGTAPAQSYIKAYNLYHGTAPYVHAHNFYLEVWLETGLLGLVSFLASIFWNIKTAAFAARRQGDRAARLLTCAAASSMAGALVCGMADYLWNYPRVLCIFWFVFSMTLAGAKVCAQPSQSPEEL